MKILGLLISIAVLMSGLVAFIWAAQWILSGDLKGIQTILIMHSFGGGGLITTVFGGLMIFAWAENNGRI